MKFLDWGFVLQCFLSFFAIMNPIGNIPIFLSLTADYPEEEKIRIARNASITAFLIVFVFIIGGNLIFRFFGITLPAFRIAGGILIFGIAYNLLKAKKTHHHHPRDEEHPEELEDIAITPLGTPILAGPGTITTALSLVGSETNYFKIFVVIGIFAVICFLTYICFKYSELLVKKLPPYSTGIMTRLMGLILAVIAVQMIGEGAAEFIKNYFPFLVH